MASIIDQLIVTLGLETKDYKKGVEDAGKAQDEFSKKEGKSSKEREERAEKESKNSKKRSDEDEKRRKEKDRLEKKSAEAAKKNSDELLSQQKKVGEQFSSMRNQALAMLGVFTAGAGILEFTRATVYNTAAMGRMSQVVGLGVNEMEAWQLQAKKTGGSAEGMAAQIYKASQNVGLYLAGQGNSETSGFFQMGGSEQALHSTKTYLYDMARVIQELIRKRGEQQAAVFAQQYMGVGFEEFNLFKVGPDVLRQEIEANEKLNAVNNKTAQDMQRLLEQWENLKETLAATGVTILEDLTPELKDLGTELQKGAEWVLNNKTAIKEWVGDSANSIHTFVAEANDAAQAFGGWKVVLEALIGLKLIGMINPLIQLAGALLKVGAALGTIARFATIPAIIGEMVFHSDDLNKGEDEEIARMTAHDETVARGVRNNNPGNIIAGNWAIKHGASGSDGKFAIFPSMETGNLAAQALLQTYIHGNRNSLAKAVRAWAPPSENDTAKYLDFMEANTDIPRDRPLEDKDIPVILHSLYRYEGNGAALKILAGETGSMATPAPVILHSLYRYEGNGAALKILAGETGSMATPAPVIHIPPSGASIGRSTVNNHVTASSTIGSIVINTRATDGAGIAATIAPALKNSANNLVWAANTGVQ